MSGLVIWTWASCPDSEQLCAKLLCRFLARRLLRLGSHIRADTSNLAEPCSRVVLPLLESSQASSVSVPVLLAKWSVSKPILWSMLR